MQTLDSGMTSDAPPGDTGGADLDIRNLIDISEREFDGLARIILQEYGIRLHVHKNVHTCLVCAYPDRNGSDVGTFLSGAVRSVTNLVIRYIGSHPDEKDVFVSVAVTDSVARIVVGSAFLNDGPDTPPSIERF